MVPDNINNWIPTKHSGVPILKRSPIRKTCCLDVEEPEKGAALSSGVWLALGGDRPTRKRRGFWRHLHATSGKVIAPVLYPGAAICPNCDSIARALPCAAMIKLRCARCRQKKSHRIVLI
jgi:hypothetical protein